MDDATGDDIPDDMIDTQQRYVRIIVSNASRRHLKAIGRGDKLSDGDGLSYIVSSVAYDGALGWTIKARQV